MHGTVQHLQNGRRFSITCCRTSKCALLVVSQVAMIASMKGITLTVTMATKVSFAKQPFKFTLFVCKSSHATVLQTVLQL